jgi:hypothetical protein
LEEAKVCIGTFWKRLREAKVCIGKFCCGYWGAFPSWCIVVTKFFHHTSWIYNRGKNIFCGCTSGSLLTFSTLKMPVLAIPLQHGNTKPHTNKEICDFQISTDILTVYVTLCATKGKFYVFIWFFHLSSMKNRHWWKFISYVKEYTFQAYLRCISEQSPLFRLMIVP